MMDWHRNIFGEYKAETPTHYAWIKPTGFSHRWTWFTMAKRERKNVPHRIEGISDTVANAKRCCETMMGEH